MKNKKPILLSLFIIAVVGLHLKPAQAFNLLEPWPAAQIPVHYFVNPANFEGLDPNQVLTAVQAAANIWNSGRTRYVFGGTTNKTNITVDGESDVVFDSDPNNIGNLALTYISGTCSSTTNDQCFIYESDIRIRENTSRWHYVMMPAQCVIDQTLGNWQFYLENIAGHELGHNLGMLHNPDDATALMYPYASVCDNKWNPLPADDLAGITALYPTTPDTTPPSLSIDSPTSGSTVSGTINIQDTASDNIYVVQKNYYITSSVYGGWSWISSTCDTTQFANGQHTIRVRVFDTSGNFTEKTTSININNVPPDSTAPTVAITTPAAGANVAGTINVTASATDDVGVAKVELYVNGIVSTTSFTSPYTFALDTKQFPDGSITLTAKAYDSAGNVGTSAEVPVTVNNTVPPPNPDTTAPAKIGNLAKGTLKASSAVLTWTATGDDGKIGTATSYDIRFLATTLSATNWASATVAVGPPTPTASGTKQSYVLTALNANTKYWVGIEAVDEAGNASPLSNIVNFTTAKN